MADEVIITYWDVASVSNGGSNQPLYYSMGSGQVLDIGTRSAAIPSTVRMIRLKSKGTGFWYNIGGSGVNAAADTDGNDWLEPGEVIDILYDPANNYIDTAADS